MRQITSNELKRKIEILNPHWKTGEIERQIANMGRRDYFNLFYPLVKVGTTGTAPNFSSNSNVHTLNIPMASDAGVTAGLISKSDYDTFSGKQPAGNYITALTGDVAASGPGSASATIQNNAVTTGKIANSAVTYEKIQNVTSGRILGRSTAGAGVVEEISIGTGLSLSGGTLSSTASGTVTSVSSANAYLSVTNGTTTPTLTLNVGTTANTVAAGDDSRFPSSECGSGNKMRWNGTAWVCETDNVTDSTKVAKSGDTMTGTLNLPTNGLVVGTNQLVVSGGNVGIGTSNPGSNTKLNVNGQIVSKSHDNGSSGTVNFANGNVVTTSFDCGSNISFQNLRDGGSYTLVVTGTGTTQCAFSTSISGDDAATVTYRFTPENAARSANSHTIYSILRVGNIVYVSWITGL